MKLTKKRLEEILAEFNGVKVAIVGDFYLDRYISGSMEAISREAAVPVVRIETDTYSPGAAGNAACNLASLGAEVIAISVVGDDLSGEIMKRELGLRGVRTEDLVAAENRHTPTFNKVYASSYHGKKQQVGRFDQENDCPIGARTEARLIEALELASRECRAIVVADYVEIPDTGVTTKAVLEKTAFLTRSRNVLSIGDSRDRIAEFVGFSVLVPNDYEAAMGARVYRPHESKHISDETVLTAGRELKEITRCHTVVITRGERGMTVFPPMGKPIDVLTVPCTGEVDATGAGDTVTAAITLSLVVGADIVEAAELANLAAGTTVKKIGTTGWPTPSEILSAFDSLAPGQ